VRTSADLGTQNDPRKERIMDIKGEELQKPGERKVEAVRKIGGNAFKKARGELTNRNQQNWRASNIRRPKEGDECK